ncbi:MAG: hypothetical protein U1E59_07355 [Amaricoccus sp.]
MRIDTLKFVRRLTGAGMERPLAEAIVEGLAEADTSELATKADLAGMEMSLKAELKAEIAALRAEVKTENAENRAELFRFMMLQAATIVGLTVTLLKLLP